MEHSLEELKSQVQELEYNIDSIKAQITELEDKLATIEKELQAATTNHQEYEANEKE